MVLSRFYVIVLAFFSAVTLADTPLYSPTPDWVGPHSTLSIPETTPAGDRQYLLVETQLNLTTETPSQFKRIAFKALTAKGAKKATTLSIDFVPAHEVLSVHTVTVTRNGEIQNRQDKASIVVASIPQKRESHLYVQKQRLKLTLTDVQQGDIIDYSYSITGKNPVYGNKYDQNIRVGWPVKVEQSTVRILVPEASNLVVNNTDQKAKGTFNFNQQDGITTYLYEERQGQYGHGESQQPLWYDPYPVLHVSNFQSWQDIVDWALPTFSLNGDRSTAAIASDIAARKADNKEAQIVEAIHYAQHRIQHLGKDHALDSHPPSNPDDVIHQGFGDNKEKALLMVALLRQIGVSATPALVSDQWKGALRSRPVSTSSFDHVIVKIEHMGKAWWIDPLSTHQSSKLDTLAQSDHVLALVLKQGNNALESVPISGPDVLHEVTQNFIINKADRDSFLTVTTLMRGKEAEKWRHYLHSTPPIEVSKLFSSYYSRHFNELAVLNPIKISDDKAANQIEIIESYIIRDLWQQKESLYHLTIAGDIVDDFLVRPKKTSRKTPFHFGTDGKIVQRVQLSLPEEWQIEPVEHQISNPFFEYRSALKPMNRAGTNVPGKTYIEADYHYQAKTRYVPPARLKEYLAQIDLAWKNSEYEFVYPVN
ncbi:transglutaminase [Veronia nyctiphanis]|uniref:Transglutaminase n=1 Tax=Veronia nyctiphanis TaxID=1278244 RepID=A0A4Q0YMZ8_9GAMM|nr:DUF3857 domain-containing protein [Veronia nyctiphanis]RXJ72287.1 transglutaminase [Veronia nyctiphanis]